MEGGVEWGGLERGGGGGGQMAEGGSEALQAFRTVLGVEVFPTFSLFLLLSLFSAPQVSPGDCKRARSADHVVHIIEFRRQHVLPHASWPEDNTVGVDKYVSGGKGAFHDGGVGSVKTSGGQAFDFCEATEHHVRGPARVPVSSRGS